MLFNTLTFAIFFVVVLAGYLSLRGWAARKRLLLAASYVFYAAWNPPFAALLLFSTTMDWWLARRLSAADGRRRLWLLLSLASNLGLLGYFKYGSFLLENLRGLMATMGVMYQPGSWDIVLPVGISFYTFQSLSYTIDVYRREIRADWRFSDFALFVSFFPQLVAGPIVRAQDFLPQLTASRSTSREQIGWGLSLMTMGIFMKQVLADGLMAPVVDTVFAAPRSHGGMDTVAAVLGFSGQIFYDFAGYSLCAIGAARCFGFHLPENFRHPYGAASFSDFWRRWHISLSSWLRDYLYIPLGGKRLGVERAQLNLMLTMLLGGLWHGASWNFVLWGGLHGLLLMMERRYGRPVTGDAPVGFIRTLLVYVAVALAWIPFRASDFSSAVSVFVGLLSWHQAPRLPVEQWLSCVLAMMATLCLHIRWRNQSRVERFFSWPAGWQVAALSAMLLAIYLFSGGDERAFIYFQF